MVGGSFVRQASLGEENEHALTIFNCALSTSERSVFGFLLHIWNQYDFSFKLSDTLIWDNGHRKAFVAWANGRTLGEPFRYF